MVGVPNDMPHVLATAAIVVLPTSYGEGVPKILLEACASARPGDYHLPPRMPRSCTRRKNGLLIPEKDPEALAKAIKVLLENPVLRALMGTRGRKIVEREFTAEQMSRQTVTVYRELVEKA